MMAETQLMIMLGREKAKTLVAEYIEKGIRFSVDYRHVFAKISVLDKEQWAEAQVISERSAWTTN